MTHVIKLGLRRCGFEVDTFTDANRALENYKPHHYDIVLMDFKMPEVNGFELYNKMKELNPKVDVCFLSADSAHYEKFMMKVMPALDESHIMRKPISIANLAKRLEETIMASKTF